LAWAIELRRAADELGTLRGVFVDGVGEGATAVPGGDIAWPKVAATDERLLGVRDSKLLLLDRGAGFEGVWRFCVGTSAGFLIAVVGRDIDEMRLGVVTGVVATALTLLLPGTVMDIRVCGVVCLLGVAGRRLEEPSLVVGLLPPLLLDMAEAGRRGGGMLLSWLKKLDLRRLPLAPAGEDGRCERLSMVLSDSDGRSFLLAASSWSVSGTYSGDELLSWKPAREPAREEALEAERKPSKLPRTSSWLVMLGVRSGCEGVRLWREGGRAKGFLKADACWVVVVPLRGGGAAVLAVLGMLLTRRDEGGTREARLDFFASVAFVFGLGAAAVVVVVLAVVLAVVLVVVLVVAGGAWGGTSEMREGFRCTVGAGAGAGAGWGGRASEAVEGFLRSWLVDAGERSCWWLPEGRSTGRREAAGLGMPEGRGMLEEGSMASTGAVSVVDVAVHAYLSGCQRHVKRGGQGFGLSLVGQCLTILGNLACSDNFQPWARNAGGRISLMSWRAPLLGRRAAVRGSTPANARTALTPDSGC
jgi:hypothetical protein